MLFTSIMQHSPRRPRRSRPRRSRSSRSCCCCSCFAVTGLNRQLKNKEHVSPFWCKGPQNEVLLAQFNGPQCDQSL